MTRLRQLLRSERGTSTVSLAIGGLAFVLLIGLVVATGRIAQSKNAVTNAASAAARAASLTRNAPDARSAATAAARAAFAGEGIACTDVTVTASGGFDTPVGQPASVTVTVSCRTSLADVRLPGLASTRTFEATASSPLDTYRGRA